MDELDRPRGYRARRLRRAGRVGRAVDRIDEPCPVKPDVEHRRRLNARLRAEFIAGAEEDSRRRLERGLTAEEIERMLRRYPGDV